MEVLIPILWIAGLVLPLVKAPAWLSWLIPVAVAGLATKLYLDERAATSGDPQPRLVLLAGSVAVVIAIVAVGVGSLIERTMRPDTK